MTSRWRRARMAVAAGALGSLLIGGAAAMAAPGGNGWNSAGGDRQNTRYAASESKISPATVGRLTKKWELTTGGDVSATPAVDDQRVYVPDWAGNLYAVNRTTGAVVWQRTITQLHGVPGDKARATPALSDTALVIGDPGPVRRRWRGARHRQGHRARCCGRTQVDDARRRRSSRSRRPSSTASSTSGSPPRRRPARRSAGYACCTFRGSMRGARPGDRRDPLEDLHDARARLSRATPSGAARPPSTRSVARSTSQRATTTTCRTTVLDCVAGGRTTRMAKSACLPADDFFDSIVALDLRTGAVKWATRALPLRRVDGGLHPLHRRRRNCPRASRTRTTTSGRHPALFTVKARPARRVSSSGPGRRAVSTGHSTPTPERSCG